MNWNWLIVAWASLSTVALIIVSVFFLFMYRKVESITRDNGNMLIEMAKMKRSVESLTSIRHRTANAKSMTFTERQQLPEQQARAGRAGVPAVRPTAEVSEYGAQGTRVDLFNPKERA